MNKYCIVSLVTMSSVLTACSGGGSSSSSLTPSQNTYNGGNYAPSTTTNVSEGEANRITVIATNNGHEFINTWSTKLNDQGEFESSDEVVKINDQIMYQSSYSSAGASYVGDKIYYAASYNLDGAPSSFYTALDLNDILGLKDVFQPALADNISPSWKYENVDYSYAISNGSTVKPEEANEGVITFDRSGNSWQADFDKIKLYGELDGADVSGSMTYADGTTTMTGTFQGVDGYDQLRTEFYSAGGFAGNTADKTKTIGGTWGMGE